MMKKDLERARSAWIKEAESDPVEKKRRTESDFLTYVNSNSEYADFHGNRHLCITSLERAGLSPKMAQTLARHSDIRLTLGVYTHVGVHDQTAAIGSLPASPGEDDSIENGDQEIVVTPDTARRFRTERDRSAPRCTGQDGGESLVHPTRFERVTFGSVDRCSIQLS